MNIHAMVNLIDETLQKNRIDNNLIKESFSSMKFLLNNIRENTMDSFNDYFLYLSEYRYMRILKQKYHEIETYKDENGIKPHNMVSFNKMLNQFITDIKNIRKLLFEDIHKKNGRWVNLKDYYDKVPNFKSYILMINNNPLSEQVLNLENKSRQNPISFSIGLNYIDYFNSKLSDLKEKILSFPKINLMDIYPNSIEDVNPTYRFISTKILEFTNEFYNDSYKEIVLVSEEKERTADKLYIEVPHYYKMETGIFFNNKLLLLFFSLTRGNVIDIFTLKNNAYRYTNFYKYMLDKTSEYLRNNFKIHTTENTVLKVINSMTNYNREDLIEMGSGDYFNVLEEFLIYFENKNLSRSPEVLNKYIRKRIERINRGFNSFDELKEERIRVSLLNRFFNKEKNIYEVNYLVKKYNVLLNFLPETEKALEDIENYRNVLDVETFQKFDCKNLKQELRDEFELLKEILK